MNTVIYDENIWERIIEEKSFGSTNLAVAEAIGISRKYVNGFMLTLAELRKGDIKSALTKKEEYGLSDNAFSWLANRTCISKEMIEAAKKEMQPKKKAEKQPKAAEEPAEQKIDYTLFLQALCAHLAQTNELLNQMMDVVIPKYAADIKDNQNVNFDMLCQSQKRIEDKLEAIKIGVRRKGM